jgi:broad specificity phosphatase PhoE
VAELSWLGVVRHGESTGNVAGEYAEVAGLEVVDIAERDADVPLSATGEIQARGVGRWLAGLAPQHRPEVVVSSTYRRAIQTAELAIGDLALPVRLDERLRDRELGILERLTRQGIQHRYPQEAARRARSGEFYYRPPGGDSWTDMVLRLRSFLGDLRETHADRRVLLFAHEAVVLLLRYVIEDLTETRVREITVPRVRNGSLTCWAREGDGLRLITFNNTAHLSEAGTGFRAAPAG